MWVETVSVASEQSARRLFKPRQVASHNRHEAVDNVRSFSGRRNVGLTRRLHQPAQGRRSAAWLPSQPVPMARQKGDLTRYHSKAGAAPPRGGGPLRIPRKDLRLASAEIEVYHLATGAIEDKHRAVGHLLLNPPSRGGHIGEIARGEARRAYEGHKGSGRGFSRFGCRHRHLSYLPG